MKSSRVNAVPCRSLNALMISESERSSSSVSRLGGELADRRERLGVAGTERRRPFFLLLDAERLEAKHVLGDLDVGRDFPVGQQAHPSRPRLFSGSPSPRGEPDSHAAAGRRGGNNPPLPLKGLPRAQPHGPWPRGAQEGNEALASLHPLDLVLEACAVTSGSCWKRGTGDWLRVTGWREADGVRGSGQALPESQRAVGLQRR